MPALPMSTPTQSGSGMKQKSLKAFFTKTPASAPRRNPARENDDTSTTSTPMPQREPPTPVAARHSQSQMSQSGMVPSVSPAVTGPKKVSKAPMKTTPASVPALTAQSSRPRRAAAIESNKRSSRVIESDDDGTNDESDGENDADDGDAYNPEGEVDDDDDGDDDDMDAMLAAADEAERKQSSHTRVSSSGVKRAKLERTMDDNDVPKVSLLSRFAHVDTEDENKPTVPSARNTKVGSKRRLVDAILDRGIESENPHGFDSKRFPFLIHVRDGQKRTSDHPDYDENTLHIPTKDFSLFTPFEKQYWEIKKEYWNTVLFFKKGKFYELYEKDADIGHKEFDLKLTDRVNMRMVGVPEATYPTWAAKFLARGFKVARVDEVENSIAKGMREKAKGSGKTSKIIGRKLREVITAGTVTADLCASDLPAYLLAIHMDYEPTREAVQSQGEDEKMVIGGPDQATSDVRLSIVLADTAAGHFMFSVLDDDLAFSKLETVLLQTNPREVILKADEPNIARVTKLLHGCLGLDLQINKLKPGTEFPSCTQAERMIERENYFGGTTGTERASWPEPLRTSAAAVQDARTGSRMPRYPGILEAFGSVIWYFQTKLSNRDAETIPGGRFAWYDPMQSATSLLLDGLALRNLWILENEDGGSRGTLAELMERATTPAGKRLFRTWLCHPLRRVDAIKQRQEVVEYLIERQDLLIDLQKSMKAIPDLERLIHRATAGKLKLEVFLKLLDGLEYVLEGPFTVLHDHMSTDGRSAEELELLRAAHAESQNCPRYHEVLDFFRTAFDRRKAKEDGELEPAPGANTNFDQAMKDLNEIKIQFDRELSQLQSELAEHANVNRPASIGLSYRKVGNESYQVEVPDRYVKYVPRDWTLRSQSKAVKRYWPPHFADLHQEYIEAGEIFNNCQRRLLAEFQQDLASKADSIRPLMHTLSVLDCLCSLASVSLSFAEPSCMPELVERTEGMAPFLEVTQLRFPLANDTGKAYVPNSITLRNDTRCVMVLTGPNMGGKSTLLRQNCLGIVMAQMGCRVPAEAMCLTPVDRIFTRLGAADNLMAGQSTFMVELRETSTVLREATEDSMVILDELGRGTSTFDGYAIAHATILHMVNHQPCRAIFSTHYHSLTDELKDHPKVALGHMACVAAGGTDEDDEEDDQNGMETDCPPESSTQVNDDADPTTDMNVHERSLQAREILNASQVIEDDHIRDVVFLYTLAEGACPKSYGMNVARMAGLGERIIRRANGKAKEFRKASMALSNSGAWMPRMLSTLQRAQELDDGAIIAAVREVKTQLGK
eukprot:Clim_evm7s151 gene=Clim_evmTU7s151